ncbi:MAG: hypothetical protein N2112_14245 [Gemmataceae bacterium]|nr:hypothetical protein [Gemmataceae bacterium]
MKKKFTRRHVLGLFCLAGTGIGCSANPLYFPMMLLNNQPQNPPEFPLKPRPRAEDVKVVVLVSGRTADSPDTIGLDRALNAELISLLEERCKANKENVLVKKMKAIDEFRANNPDPTLHPMQVGKEMKADYVIEVEIQELELFKPGSRRQFLQGTANLTVNAYDTSKVGKEAAYSMTLAQSFPRDREVPVESPASIENFRREFVKRLASAIVVKFTTSSTDQKFQMS